MAKLSKGLSRDSNPIDQPEGTWRYAKNALLKRDIGGLSNEAGIELQKSLGDKVCIGAIEVSEVQIIIFAVSPETAGGNIFSWNNNYR